LPKGVPARTHLPYELVDSLVDGILLKVELGGYALRLVSESHAALGSGVEGAFELDVLHGLWADWWLVEDEGVPEGDSWGRRAPKLGLVEDFADRVREAGREEG
jgi:hypothetical protein